MFPFSRRCHQILVPFLPCVSLVDHQAFPLHYACHYKCATSWVLSCHVFHTCGIPLQPQFDAGADLPTQERSMLQNVQFSSQ